MLQLGYLALRRVPGDPDARARRCAIGALIAAVDVPIVHFSVDWWRTLHQGATVLNANLSPTIHGIMAWTLLLGFVAFTLVFAWMLPSATASRCSPTELEGAELDDRPARAVGRGDDPVADTDAALAASRRHLMTADSRAATSTPATASRLGVLALYAALLWRSPAATRAVGVAPARSSGEP